MRRAARLGLLGNVLLGIVLLDGLLGGWSWRLAAAEPPASRLARGGQASPLTDGSDETALPAAMSPDESLAAMRVRPGLVVELVAAEPLVQDPVALDWGPDGRLWVVEMGDYPNGLDGQGQPGGRVRMLEDRDGDGRFDHSTVFLDQLPFPTGVKAWRNGVLVTAAPEIFYADDQDGDGRADRRITLYQGFVAGNQQHRVNGMRWGLDNWLYVANGDSGGKVVAVGTQQSVDIRGRDLRLRPDEGLLEADSGQTQFGRDRDDWGHWFGGNNSHPLWHYVLADRYLRRNPHFAPPQVRHETSQPPGAAPVFPLSRTLARFNDFEKANRFTSACSPAFYRDTLLGEAFAGNVFICEPVHNLVHRELVEPRGATFASRRAEDEQQSEFLASRDNWFRPTMVRTGPDGAVWVVDMYRLVIEHPEWIPADWQRRLNLRAGDDRGRIYRVLPAGQRRSAVPPRLDKLTTAELVAALASPNGWQRDMAQQLLLWRHDPAAVEPLNALLRGSDQALARLHALATLDGLNAIDGPRLELALSDPHAGVRRHAVRVAERHLKDGPRIVARLLELAGDPDAHVRLQLACTLGEVPDERAAAALAQLALQPAEDNFQTWAALTSVHSANIRPLLARVLEAGGDEAARPRSLRLAAQLLSIAAGLDQRELVNETLRALVAPRPDEAPGQQLARLSEALETLAGQAAGVRRLLDPSTRG
ncbi:MAG: HEAT repeat domain-containing protein, partial [Pirellulaceae bacterium]|nr:HEAT repeat domain-containing protein [Pirellulaceae bacterium]